MKNKGFRPLKKTCRLWGVDSRGLRRRIIYCFVCLGAKSKGKRNILVYDTD